ncbi:MAG: cysteine desulfurase family protein [Acidimicrobiales bacterium]
MTRHYLDHASTSPLRPIARAALAQALELPAADPGRLHEEGLTTRQALELARTSVAELVGARASEVVFTSSATEAIVSAVWGSLTTIPGTVIATAVEHSAVRASADRVGKLRTVGVDGHGLVDPQAVADAIDDEQRSGRSVSLVCCQLANHEVGTIQPVVEVMERAKARGVRTLVDAAQAVGRIPVDMRALDADFLAVSGHKLGGPAGSGALVVRRGIRIAPLLVGGEQERARRAGLENMPAAVAFGAAAAELVETLADEAAEAERLTNRLRAGLAAIEGITPYGHPEQRLPHLVCVGIADIEPQAVILGLDRAGIAAHSGSACASEGLEPSPVLEAMGVDAHRSLRLSVGWSTTDDDIDAALDALPRIIADLRALRP